MLASSPTQFSEPRHSFGGSSHQDFSDPSLFWVYRLLEQWGVDLIPFDESVSVTLKLADASSRRAPDEEMRIDARLLSVVGDLAVWQVPVSRPSKSLQTKWLKAMSKRMASVPRRTLARGRGVRALAVFAGEREPSAATLAVLMPGLDRTELFERTFDAQTIWDLTPLRVVGSALEADVDTFLFDLEEVLEKKDISAAFVRQFRTMWTTLNQSWTGLNTANAEDVRHLSLSFLTRLLFLAFIQDRGWLDGRRNYLQEEVAARSAVYTSLLKPLCFEILNLPADQRAPEHNLGDIPYLNGGLFEETPLERAHPNRNLPCEIVRNIVHQFFQRFVFNCGEGHPPNPGMSRRGVVDPAMLGRVFETLMGESERQTTGSFYTPRAVVRRTVESALVQHCVAQLAETTSGGTDHNLPAGIAERPTFPAKTLRPLLASLLENGDTSAMPESLCFALHHVLRRVRIIDPACGSGAFLLGAFGVLFDAVSVLERRLSGTVDPFILARDIATQNLYGVDLLPHAIRLCELRLWLAICEHHPRTRFEGGTADIVPLPNLDLGLRQGNSLLSPLEFAPARLDAREMLTGTHLGHPRVLSGDLAELKQAYRQASGKAKARIAKRIQEREVILAGQVVATRMAELSRREEAFLTLAQSADLFGGKRQLTKEERAELKRVRSRLRSISALHAKLVDGERNFFAFEVHFAEVMETGGFDIVVGNPPWVRPHHQPRDQKDALKRRYHVCHKPAWRPPVSGISTRSAQIDLASVFVERSLHLVKPGGAVSLLVPSKLFTSLSGGGLRRLIGESATVCAVSDWSQAKEMFGATTYPAHILLMKRPSDGREVVRVERVVDNSRHWNEGALCTRREMRTLRFEPCDLSSPWLVGGAEYIAELARMRRCSKTVGERFKIRRGLFTGANSVFVPTAVVDTGDEGLVEARFGTHEAILERDALIPVLRGSDVAAYSATPAKQMILTHDRDGEPLQALPQRVGEYLCDHRDRLRARTDLRGGEPWWRIFRVRSSMFGPKVVWRDISRELEAACVAYPTALPLNTTYYIAPPSEIEGLLLAALMNSKAARRFAAMLADHAQGGYRRYFGWVVGLLPWPFDDAPSDIVARIAELSAALHGERGELCAAVRATLVDEIDLHIHRLFGPSDEPLA